MRLLIFNPPVYLLLRARITFLMRPTRGIQILPGGDGASGGHAEITDFVGIVRARLGSRVAVRERQNPPRLSSRRGKIPRERSEFPLYRI